MSEHYLGKSHEVTLRGGPHDGETRTIFTNTTHIITRQLLDEQIYSRVSETEFEFKETGLKEARKGMVK